MGFLNQSNCSLGFDFYFEQTMQVDPDIAGVGVVVSFMATAYIAWTLFFLNYVFAYDPTHPAGTFVRGVHDRLNAAGSRPNPIDIHTIAWFKRVMRVKARHPHVARIFDECILSMCDIQIMTGFALLSCGFTLAFSASEPLASYHWFLIVCLAWFSAITHLAGLSILRTYLDCRPRVKATRIVLMFLLLVCLIIALIPTGFFNWHQMKSVAAPQSPAICFFDISAAMKLWNRDWYGSEVMETSAMQQMVLAVILLVLGFTSRCIKLFQPLSRMLRRAVRTPAHDYFTLMFNRLAILLLRRPQKNASLDMTVRHESFWNQFWTFAVFIPLVGLFLTGRFFGDLISSMLAEIVWVIIAIMWGTIKFVILRYDEPPTIFSDASAASRSGGSQRWTFGQMMAVALLASPLVSLIWKFSELATKHGTSSEQDTGSEHGRQSTRDLLASSTSETSGSQNRLRTQYQDRNAAATRYYSPETTLSKVVNRDYYEDAPWIWPCIVQSYCVLIVLAFGSFRLTSVGHGHTMTDFWIAEYSMLSYLLLGFPAACATTMIAGLNLDHWYKHPSGWKWTLLFCTGICVHAVYLASHFFAKSWWVETTGIPSLVLILLPYSLYILYFFFGCLIMSILQIKSYLVNRQGSG